MHTQYEHKELIILIKNNSRHTTSDPLESKVTKLTSEPQIRKENIMEPKPSPNT